MADVRYIKLLDEPNRGTVIKQEGHKFFGFIDGEWKRRGLSVGYFLPDSLEKYIKLVDKNGERVYTTTKEAHLQALNQLRKDYGIWYEAR